MAGFALAPLLGALALAAAPWVREKDEPAPAVDRLTFRLDVNFIEVSAVVTDPEGRFVPGLTRDDFQILEDGKPQEIAAFTLVDLPRRQRRRTPQGVFLEPDVPTNQDARGRLFVLLMDDLRTVPDEASPAPSITGRPNSTRRGGLLVQHHELLN